MTKKTKAKADATDPAMDPSMEKVRFLFEESGLSLVDLGKRMGYADETARQAAWQFMKTRDPRMSMLRRFADAMGMPIDKLLPKGKRMSRKLEAELDARGCDMTRAQFHEFLELMRVTHFPNRTPDELVCHPDEAKAYCERVRAESNNQKLDDFLVLRTLLNARKAAGS